MVYILKWLKNNLHITQILQDIKLLHTKLTGFEVFLAFLQTRRSGSLRISGVKKLEWTDYISPTVGEGVLLMKQTLLK